MSKKIKKRHGIITAGIVVIIWINAVLFSDGWRTGAGVVDNLQQIRIVLRQSERVHHWGEPESPNSMVRPLIYVEDRAELSFRTIYLFSITSIVAAMSVLIIILAPKD
ncbi:hypothetical protein [Pseudohongiella acticola]|jgi:hypothetical protein|uniref:hypothetical protein n=1 Tax=Pseudohongiella acticola TaxID=1524254 RepID=UPI0030EF124D|tara:strand:+ start:267 stop:590 length:324 start_codon:yes stop_codon:yes gene_type:complete